MKRQAGQRIANAKSKSRFALEVFTELGVGVLDAFLGSRRPASVIAYGQTGSGKTHTMLGTPEEPGLIPRLCEALLATAPLGRFHLSLYEIYNGRVRDLLCPDQPALRVRQHPSSGPYVEGTPIVGFRCFWSFCCRRHVGKRLPKVRAVFDALVVLFTRQARKKPSASLCGSGSEWKLQVASPSGGCRHCSYRSSHTRVSRVSLSRPEQTSAALSGRRGGGAAVGSSREEHRYREACPRVRLIAVSSCRPDRESRRQLPLPRHLQHPGRSAVSAQSR